MPAAVITTDTDSKMKSAVGSTISSMSSRMLPTGQPAAAARPAPRLLSERDGPDEH